MEIVKHEIGENGALLTGYLQESSEAIYGSSKRPAVLVLAGGGYEFVSDPEREPVAMAYASKGYQTFTLVYSVKENGVFPEPQREALAAVSYIRKNAEKFYLDPDKIAVVGFSAGGHLAASTGVFWNHKEVNLSQDREACKPNALVLVYPCITAGEYAYEGLVPVHGKGCAMPEKLGLENYVSGDTPPSFLCHTAEDTCVPVMNSLLFAQRLAENKIPFELHVYKEGPHGMSLGTGAVSSPFLRMQEKDVRTAVGKIALRFSDWFEKSVEFLNLVFEPVTLGMKDGKIYIK